MKLITLPLLLLSSSIFAQINFKVPLDVDVLDIRKETLQATKLIDTLYFYDSNDKRISLDGLPLDAFVAANSYIFPQFIAPSEFNIFLASQDFNNKLTLSKKSLIKQGIIYFIEKKPIFELCSKYLNPNTGLFDLNKFEINFFKKLDEHDLKLLMSFVEIFEHWEDYSAVIKPYAFANVPESEIDDLKNLVNRYLNDIIKNQYLMYSYVNSSNVFAKSLYIDHGNDIFLPINNRDRDMTGSFRVELATDLLKMRLFTKSNRSEILSYQSVFFGGEGYTPYIRYNPDNLLANASVDEQFLKDNFSYGINKFGKYNEEFINNYLSPVVDVIQKTVDRPFASFQYIGRAKYRMPIHGLWRYLGEFKLGFLGKNLGRDIQSAIHKDVNPSIKVLNWEKQIGFPGRLAFEIHIRRDRLLLSKGNSVRLNKFNYTEIPNAKMYPWINVYSFVEGSTGTVQDALAIGFGFSNKNFIKQSGQKEVKFNSRLPINNLFISAETKLKYQIHNSLLQGLGWLNTFKNEAKSDVNRNSFVLASSDLKRFVWFNDLKFSYRVNKVAITYTASLNTQEFCNNDYQNSGKFVGDGSNKFLKNYIIDKFTEPKQAIFADLLLNNNEISNNFEVPKFHFVGTLGFNFFIK